MPRLSDQGGGAIFLKGTSVQVVTTLPAALRVRLLHTSFPPTPNLCRCLSPTPFLARPKPDHAPPCPTQPSPPVLMPSLRCALPHLVRVRPTPLSISARWCAATVFLTPRPQLPPLRSTEVVPAIFPPSSGLTPLAI